LNTRGGRIGKSGQKLREAIICKNWVLKMAYCKGVMISGGGKGKRGRSVGKPSSSDRIKAVRKEKRMSLGGKRGRAERRPVRRPETLTCGLLAVNQTDGRREGKRGGGDEEYP